MWYISVITSDVYTGVPQGSVFGPLMFAMYISLVDNVVAAHRIHLHQCADDTQLYVVLHPFDVSPFDVVSHCVSDISRWFREQDATRPQQD